MADYLPPTENLPIFDSSVFTDANEGFLTYDKAKKLFLRYPIAQGNETLQNIVVNGTSLLNDNLTMSSSDPAKRVIQCGDFRLDENTGAYGPPIFQIYSSGVNNFYKNLVSSNASNIKFQLKNAGGTLITPLTLTPFNTTVAGVLYANNGIEVSTGSSIFNTGINIYSTSTFDGTINLAVSRTFNVNNNANIDVLSGGKINIKAGGNITFDSNILGDAVTMGDVKVQMTNTKLNMNTTVITQSGFGTNLMQNITMNSNANVIFNNHIGKIYQPTADALSTNRNELHRTDVYIRSAATGGANDIAFKVYDVLTGSDERGFIVYPNASSSGTPANSVVVSKDTVIASSNTSGSNNALCLTSYSSDKIGIRIDCTIPGSPVIGLAAGTNTVLIDKNKTSFNTVSHFTAGLYSNQNLGNVTAGVLTTTMNLLANETVFYRAITFNNALYGVAPAILSSQLGYVISSDIPDISVASGLVRSFGGIAVGIGCWIIEFNCSIAPETVAATFSRYSTGLSTTNNAYETTGSLTASNYDIESITLPAYKYYTNTSRATYRTTTVTTIYLNMGITYTGATNCLAHCSYTLTRIG